MDRLQIVLKLTAEWAQSEGMLDKWLCHLYNETAITVPEMQHIRQKINEDFAVAIEPNRIEEIETLRQAYFDGKPEKLRNDDTGEIMEEWDSQNEELSDEYYMLRLAEAERKEAERKAKLYSTDIHTINNTIQAVP